MSFSGRIRHPRGTRQDHLLKRTRATTLLAAAPNTRRRLVAAEHSQVFPETPAASYPLFLWNSAHPVPKREPHHPARSWMTARNLYWPSISVPSAIRWFPATDYWPKHWGSGAIVVAFAPPDAWVASWPQTPAPTDILMFHIDNFGKPALGDRNRPAEHTRGVTSGTVCFLGDPRPDLSTTGRLILTKSFAEALALAARLPDTAAIAGGTSELQAEELAAWLRDWDNLPIYAYSKTEESNEVHNLRTKNPVTVPLCQPEARLITDYTRTNHLPLVDLVTARQTADDLEKEGLPRWEAERLAIQVAPESPANKQLSIPVREVVTSMAGSTEVSRSRSGIGTTTIQSSNEGG